MKSKLLVNKSKNKDFIFMVYLFKYKYLFNSISQPHLRNIIYLSAKLNSDKYSHKIISEI